MTELRTAQSERDFPTRTEKVQAQREKEDPPRWLVYLGFIGFCAAVWAIALTAIFLIF